MGVGRVFVRFTEGLEPLAGREAGIRPLIPDDTYEIEVEKLAAFSRVLLDWYFHSNHPVHHGLFGGVLKCSPVMLDRTGNPIELDTTSQERRAFAQEVAEQARSTAR